MDLVQAFNERDFAVMAEWYLLNGENIILRNQMHGDLDEYLEGRLIEEIEPLLPDLTTSRKEKSVHDKMMDEPENVQAVYNRGREYFKQMKEARIGVTDKDGQKTEFGIFDERREVRKKAAFEVKRLARLNKEGWMDINHYQRHGYLPSALSENEEILSLSIMEAVKLLRLDENYVFKYSKKLKTLKGSEKEVLEQRIKERKERIVLINKKFEYLDTTY